MNRLNIEYPESLLSALNLSRDSFEEEARLALAVKLYEVGRLSSGQAAALAGKSRVVFLFNCSRYGAASVSWDREEIEAEFGED